MQVCNCLSKLLGDLIAKGSRDCMGVVSKEILKGGCVGDELKDDVYLSLVLKTVAHLNHARVLQFAQYFYFLENPSSFRWLY